MAIIKKLTIVLGKIECKYFLFTISTQKLQTTPNIREFLHEKQIYQKVSGEGTKG